MTPYLLIVDDDVRLVRLLERTLRKAGYAVESAFDGETGLAKAQQPGVQLLVLDLILPPTSGIEVLRQFRTFTSAVPVLILSARAEVKVRVQALKLGADDYLIKPFDKEELIARVEALLRRTSAKHLFLTAEDLTMDLSTRAVTRGGRPILLSPTEFRLLEFLLRNKNTVVPRQSILERVWGYDFDPGTNLLSVYMSYLRSAIDDGFDVKLIQTVRGRGFVIGAESNGKDAGSARKGGSSG